MSTQPIQTLPPQSSETRVARQLHPAWLELIRQCEVLGYGELALLKIQDGVPVMAEVVTKKVKFMP
jgi:hypothetical protein